MSAFSGANPIDDTILICFNLLFNSLPPLIQGILDQDLSQHTLMMKPQLYQQGVKCEIYRPKMFWFYWLGGAYHSICCFFIPYGVYYGSDIDFRTLGWVCTTAVLMCNLISQGIEYKTWTWIHWLLLCLSFVVYILFTLIYCSVTTTITAITPSSYGIFFEQFGSGAFWTSIFLAVGTAIMPHIIFRTMEVEFWASDSVAERAEEHIRKPKAMGNWVERLFANCCSNPN